LELGSGRRLLELLRQRLGSRRDAVWLACRPEDGSGRAPLLRVLADLYMQGIDPAWHDIYREGPRRRVALPTYPFQRKRYWRGASGRAFPKSQQPAERRTGSTSERGLRPGAPERVHATLASIVARVLGHETAPAASMNLVDAGVDSLRAMELLGDIARTFGVRLTPSDFNVEPTLAALAERIVAAGSKPATASESCEPRIVTIREGQAGTPVVCFHPAGGQVTAYMALRGLVAGNCPIVAVQSRALQGSAAEFATLEQMAEAYAARVAALGHRSVRLFGWSLGGAVAHGVARVLELQGVSVERVGMVDPPEPGATLEVTNGALALTGIVYDHNPAAPPPERLANIVAELGCSERSPREWLAECERRGFLPGGALAAEEFERAWALYRAHARLIAAFSPRAIRAPIQLWWAARRAGSRWASTSGAVRERQVGGTHYTIMRMPRLASIADEL
jgi:thioesterase domain-containing protein/acyl carrier protein